MQSISLAFPRVSMRRPVASAQTRFGTAESPKPLKVTTTLKDDLKADAVFVASTMATLWKLMNSGKNESAAAIDIVERCKNPNYKFTSGETRRILEQEGLVQSNGSVDIQVERVVMLASQGNELWLDCKQDLNQIARALSSPFFFSREQDAVSLPPRELSRLYEKATRNDQVATFLVDKMLGICGTAILPVLEALELCNPVSIGYAAYQLKLQYEKDVIRLVTPILQRNPEFLKNTPKGASL